MLSRKTVDFYTKYFFASVAKLIYSALLSHVPISIVPAHIELLL